MGLLAEKLEADAQAFQRVNCLHEALEASVKAAEAYLDLRKRATSSTDRQRYTAAFDRVANRADGIRKEISKQNWPLNLSKPSAKQLSMLWKSSRVGGRVFPPWQELDGRRAQGDVHSRSPTAKETEFVDPAGLMSLSYEQMSQLSAWKRVAEIWDAPRMGFNEDGCLIQETLSNCSIVAAFCALAEGNLKGAKNPLVSRIHADESRKGRYLVRLTFNGCDRKVIIDDLLPVLKSGWLLGTRCYTKDWIWPALLEKAYLKVMGGYGFPGSNTAFDIHVFSGWLPSYKIIRAEEFDADRCWNKIEQAFHKGNVIVTLGTGWISELEKSIGLTANHSYAVVDVNVEKCSLLVKDPNIVWAWKNRCDRDSSICGCFWIQWADICQYWEYIYLNWNPAMFQYQRDVHFTWEMKPNLELCTSQVPQFTIHNPSDSSTTVSIELTLHTATAYAEGYRALHITSSPDRLNGPIPRCCDQLNSRNVLKCVDIDAQAAKTVVVVTQEMPPQEYTFTLSVFSSAKVGVAPAVSRLKFSQSITSAWPLDGGSSLFLLEVKQELEISLQLESQLGSLHISLTWSGRRRPNNTESRDVVCHSGEYQKGTALASTAALLPGLYTIICSTYENVVGDFLVLVESSEAVTVRANRQEHAGRLKQRKFIPLNGSLCSNVVLSANRQSDVIVSCDSDDTVMEITAEIGSVQASGVSRLATHLSGKHPYVLTVRQMRGNKGGVYLDFFTTEVLTVTIKD